MSERLQQHNRSHDQVTSPERALRIARAAESLGTHTVQAFATEGDRFTPPRGHSYRLEQGQVGLRVAGPDTGDLYTLVRNIERGERKHHAKAA